MIRNIGLKYASKSLLLIDVSNAARRIIFFHVWKLRHRNKIDYVLLEVGNSENDYKRHIDRIYKILQVKLIKRAREIR